MMYATHVVGLTQASLRSLHVMMVRHLRAIMQSPRHLTQEADLAFLQRISPGNASANDLESTGVHVGTRCPPLGLLVLCCGGYSAPIAGITWEHDDTL